MNKKIIIGLLIFTLLVYGWFNVLPRDIDTMEINVTNDTNETLEEEIIEETKRGPLTRGEVKKSNRVIS